MVMNLEWKFERSMMKINWCILILFVNLLTLDAQSICSTRCQCYLNHVPSTIMCAKQGLENFPTDISDIVQNLDLSGNILRELPDEVTKFRKLQYLNLAHNRLTALPGNLQGLDNLRELDLRGNRINDVANIVSISQLSYLENLYLAENPITDLKGLKSETLQYLDCARCGIREINAESFIGMSRLADVTLSGNPLTSVNKPKSEVLRRLDLSDCRMNVMSPDAFQDMPSLEDLRMANNPKLVYSTGYDTLTHPGLKMLDVSRCNLDRPGLHGLPSLTHVTLSRNIIQKLPDGIFSKNRKLTQLYLHANELHQLNRKSFAGLYNLRVLDLSGNAIQEIHWTAFIESNNLTILNLAQNSMIQFPNLTTSANLLNLSGNFISSMEHYALMNMSKLTTLDLSHNRLESIPDNLDSQHLRILYLQENRLVELTNQSLYSLPDLVSINLAGNRLMEGPDPEVFFGNIDLEHIYMDNNPWRCECEQLRPSYMYLTATPAKTIHSTLICLSPSNVSGLSWNKACNETWTDDYANPKNRAWGFVLVSLLMIVIVFGSIVSLRHTMKMKRQSHLERQEAERMEARERLRLLQRRNQLIEDELEEQNSEPRIHPLELVGPPSYEEAVQMPRLAQSLDGLDSISVDNFPSNNTGSMDNLRTKKRRSRRPRKRTLSDDNLVKREERRVERLRRLSLNNSINNLVDTTQSPESINIVNSTRNLTAKTTRRSDSEGGTSHKGRPRPLTPAARLKKRRQVSRNGHSSDDEDSEFSNSIMPVISKSHSSIVIQNLTREPRSGFRGSAQESDF